MSTELDAAGITSDALRQAYTRCRELNARHGKTYFLATRLLAPYQRPAIHALYGFARWADDIVDDLADSATVEQRSAGLDAVEAALEEGLRTGGTQDPVLAAVAHTAAQYSIAPELFAAFMRSMRMDLSRTDYATRAELDDYVYGSAEVIGLFVLPVLGTVGPQAQAAPHAAALGKAFQLTNFIRDVGEDLDRGRVYLPADELAAHGVDHELLVWCRRTGQQDRRVKAAVAEQIATTRAIYATARPGIELLAPASRPCVRAAFVLYGEILDRVEAAEYDVLRQRARVPNQRRAQIAAGGFARAWWTRGRSRLVTRP